MGGYQETSAIAWNSIQDYLGSKQYEVLRAISVLRECNNQDIARYLGIEINRVTPRVFELRRKGLVEESRQDRDIETGRLTNFWRLKTKQSMNLIKFKNGNTVYVDSEKVSHILSILSDNTFPSDYKIVGKNNTVNKGDIETIWIDDEIVYPFTVKHKPPKMFWKVRLSYNDETENVIITKNDLIKTQYAFATNSKLILPQGAFRGQDIISILPDYVMTMGWNRGYEPTEAEWAEIRQNPTIKSMGMIMANVKLICENSKSVEEAEQKFIENQKLLN